MSPSPVRHGISSQHTDIDLYNSARYVQKLHNDCVAYMCKLVPLINLFYGVFELRTGIANFLASLISQRCSVFLGFIHCFR